LLSDIIKPDGFIRGCKDRLFLGREKGGERREEREDRREKFSVLSFQFSVGGFSPT
jgi:hypothetical protein